MYLRQSKPTLAGPPRFGYALCLLHDGDRQSGTRVGDRGQRRYRAQPGEPAAGGAVGYRQQPKSDQHQGQGRQGAGPPKSCCAKPLRSIGKRPARTPGRATRSRSTAGSYGLRSRRSKKSWTNTRRRSTRRVSGSRGSCPRCVARLVNERFKVKVGREAEIKVTAPPDLVRNRKARPDRWETDSIRTKLKAPNWPRGRVYAGRAIERRSAGPFESWSQNITARVACHAMARPRGRSTSRGTPGRAANLAIWAARSA